MAPSELPIAFVELRRLAEWFGACPTRPSLHVERIVKRLGVVAVPMLGRELLAEPNARGRPRSLAQLAARGEYARAA